MGTSELLRKPNRKVGGTPVDQLLTQWGGGSRNFTPHCLSLPRCIKWVPGNC